MKTMDEHQLAKHMRSSFEAGLSRRIARSSRVNLQHVIPSHWFSAAASECQSMFIEGHFYGTISLAQAHVGSLSNLCETYDIRGKGRNRSPPTLDLPVLPVLQSIIDASQTGDLSFLVTEQDKPFTAAGFTNWFRDRCNEAGLPGLAAHGLRQAGATRAAENGATAHQLMAFSIGRQSATPVRRNASG